MGRTPTNAATHVMRELTYKYYLDNRADFERFSVTEEEWAAFMHEEGPLTEGLISVIELGPFGLGGGFLQRLQEAYDLAQQAPPNDGIDT